MAWLQRAAPALHEEQAVPIGLLETLVSEAARLQVVMPEYKLLKERLAAARRLVNEVRPPA